MADVPSKNTLLTDLTEIFNSVYETVSKKNADYSGLGPDPYRNQRHSTVVNVDPQKAILVRMMDKMARAGNLLDQAAAVKDESFEDTLKDLIGYAGILISYRRNNK